MNAPITVDALLSAIEPVLARTGRIVTALRINGVEEPAFRDAAFLERGLSIGDGVDIDTTPAAVMAGQALDDARRFLPELSAGAREVAAAFRGPSPGDARPALGGLADNLALLVALVHTADLWARQAGLAATEWLGEDVTTVEHVAGTLQTATDAGDWAAAATALETHLPQALEAWHARLTTGRADLDRVQLVATA